jgi:hypothetical protein
MRREDQDEKEWEITRVDSLPPERTHSEGARSIAAVESTAGVLLREGGTDV